ncbi:MAG TPA: vitamin K epoxide reductase family protein [Acidobacteriaceae bacterium]|nr:vitamin K epoxide reductase family protein [Acidobacteriaceae bacterium]
MRYAIVVLALLGVVVSALALRVHYTTGTEPCDINSHWDCGTVNRSSYATVDGILWHIRAARHPDDVTGPAPRTGFPVATLGIIGYALIALFAFLRQRALTVVFALGGLGVALYLSHIEAHVLEVWCLYCVISQTLIAIITLLAFVALFVRRRTA